MFILIEELLSLILIKVRLNSRTILHLGIISIDELALMSNSFERRDSNPDPEEMNLVNCGSRSPRQFNSTSGSEPDSTLLEARRSDRVCNYNWI